MNRIVVDFEATCCTQDEFPRDEMEIIEIGACCVSNELEVISDFQAFIRPVRNPMLTEFCKELTTISQDDVDGADIFPAVLERFKVWIDSYESSLFCSWGAYDKKQLLQDCNYHKVQFPFSDEHLNLKVEYSSFLSSKKKFGVGQALRKAGMEFVGTQHRGIDDARNISRLVSYIYGKV